MYVCKMFIENTTFRKNHHILKQLIIQYINEPWYIDTHYEIIFGIYFTFKTTVHVVY